MTQLIYSESTIIRGQILCRKYQNRTKCSWTKRNGLLIKLVEQKKLRNVQPGVSTHHLECVTHIRDMDVVSGGQRLEAFEMWAWRRMASISYTGKSTRASFD